MRTKSPLVSVIIASKNTAEYISACMESIKHQTYKNIEIIVVDNYSTDGTYEIAQKYADKVFQKGPERSTQFNYGFSQSKGDYIYRIGPDYVLEPDLIEKCVKRIRQGFDALALHNRSAGKSIWAKVRYLERESYRNDKLIVAVRFMRREVFESVGGFDESLIAGEDFDLHTRIEKAGYKWDHVDAIENHIGEPKNIIDVWNKFYYYGRTIGRYNQKNKEAARKQMVLFRPSFKKLQKQLVQKPHLFLAFWFYMFVKATAGICGMLRGAPKSLKAVDRQQKEFLLSKNPLVSVIVPTYNSGRFLDACLRSIKDQSYKNIELIVVDNNSSDETKKIAKKYTRYVFNKSPERSAQRNYGVKQSSGEYVLIIDSDMQLTEDVVTACVEAAIKNPNLGALIIPEESFGTGLWAQCKKLERSFYVGVDWIEAARFFNKKTYLEAGGFDERMVSGEDWDLSQRIETISQIGRVNEYILHNEGHLSLLRTIKKKYYYSQHIITYIAHSKHSRKKKIQINALTRYKLFLSQPAKLFRNPFIGVALLLMKTAEFIAGGAGYSMAKVRKAVT